MGLKRLRLGIGIRGWRIVLASTILGTLVCALVSLALNYVAYRLFGDETIGGTMIGAAIGPVVVAAPLFFIGSARLLRLSRRNRRLNAAARTDALTACLNRGAFTRQVGLALRNDRDTQVPRGALLMIDVDAFKAINDRFGHQHGDQALVEIASALRLSVRIDDVVGRLGGEEFGIFLPGASHQTAEAVAHRIHVGIGRIAFAPEGVSHPLRVSIGGLAFTSHLSFAELYRLADRNLYTAKASGGAQSRIDQVAAPPPQPNPAAGLH